MSLNYKSSLLEILGIIFLSTIIFIFTTGGKIIYFDNIDWLFGSRNIVTDSEQHYISWLFFRNSDFFQFPLFKNYHYGMEISSSLIHSDSIPIMAIFFKAFKHFLPFNFQYFGLWIYLSFILQGLFPFLIIKKFTKSYLIGLLCSSFFLLAPVLTYRLFWGHESLFGQWIILCGLYLYLNDYNLKKWIALSSLSLLVHPYFFAMITLLFFATLIKEILDKQLSFKKIITPSLIYIATSLTLQIIFGYYAIGLNFLTSGYDFFKANMNTLFDSSPGYGIDYSRVLPDLYNSIPPIGGEYEGFAFLGIGVFIILILNLFKFSQEKLVKKEKFSNSVKVLIYLTVLLIIYSLSNKISIGQYEILSYPLPPFIKFITETFRVSGRFIWPIYYIIYIGSFYLLIKNFSPKYVAIILLCALSLQTWDMFPNYNNLRTKMLSPQIYYKDFNKSDKYKLNDPKWKIIGSEYNNLYYVYPHYAPENFVKLSMFASKYKLKVNFGYFSRTDKSQAKKEREKLQSIIINNNLSKNSIYYIHDSEVIELVKNNQSNYNLIKLEDNLLFLIPNK